jgi:hypothetical protein
MSDENRSQPIPTQAQLLAIEAVILQLSVALDKAGLLPVAELLASLQKSTHAVLDETSGDFERDGQRAIAAMTGRLIDALKAERAPNALPPPDTLLH